MSLSVVDALRDGLGRTFERNGLQLVAAFVALQFASTVASDTVTRANLELAAGLDGFPDAVPPGIGETPTPFALGLGLGVALALFVAVAILAEAVRIVAVRTLVSDRTDTIPGEYARRNIGVATLNGFVGGVVVLTLTVIGLAFLVVPGLFLALSFLFVRQEIAVRDVNFVEAMSGSWQLASGNRLELLALGVVLVLAEFVAAVPGFLVAALDPTVGGLVTAFIRAVVVVFAIASVSRAYVQLREADAAEDVGDGVEEGDEDAVEEDDEPSYEGALTADDLPPPEDNAR